MTPLRDAVDEYIALRRGLGFKLRDMATGLTEFSAFLEQHAASSITTALAVAWAMQPVDHQPSDWAKRLGFVRVFARHWSATDPRTEILAAGLLPFRAKRARPYLYTDEEIRQLLAATKMLSSTNGLRPWTYACLFGLLVVSGIRISEAIALERRDVDLDEGLLTIRKTEFNKTRLFLFMCPRGTSSSRMPDGGTDWCRTPHHRRFSSTIMDVVWKSPRCTGRSTTCRVGLACGDQLPAPVRGFTISAIDLPSTR